MAENSNRLEFQRIYMKNFMSVGNVMQVIEFDDGVMRVITGEDVDAPKLKRSGIGKAQPLYAKVRTPYGWKRIGDLGVGDSVSSPDGTTTIINGVYPQGKKEVYTITFQDGRKTQACKEHLWKVYIRSSGKWDVVSTEHIAKYISEGTDVYIDTITGLSQPPVNDLGVDPYLLGLALVCGEELDDGSLLLKTFDESVLDALNERYHSHKDVSVFQSDIGIVVMDDRGDIIQGIRSVSDTVEHTMMGKATWEQREQFLRGIFDIYAYEENNNVVCVFSGIHKRLAIFVRNLAWSLGGKSFIKKKIISDEIMNLDEEFTVVSRFRDANKFFSSIEKKVYGTSASNLIRFKSIDKAGEEECVCISVISNSKLYVTDDYIITHNTTVPNGLSFACFGKPVTDIKPKRLVNKTNEKAMYVRVDFRKNGKEYYVERGAKPDIFKFAEVVNGEEKEIADTTQGTKADTQEAIERVLGISHQLFTQIVAINTSQASYMKSPLSKQRDIIEEILKVTELTHKAKILSERTKETKIEIEREKVRIESVKKMYDQAVANYTSLNRQRESWDFNRQQEMSRLLNEATALMNIDIDAEISAHEHNSVVREKLGEKQRIISESNSTRASIDQCNRRLNEISRMLDSFSTNTCPTCRQTINDGSHEDHKKKLTEEANEYFQVLDGANAVIESYDKEIASFDGLEYQKTYYQSIQDAYRHQQRLAGINEKYTEVENSVNPFSESVAEAAKQVDQSVVSYDILEGLEKRLHHQQTLYKLLTSRDSFLRKRIIDNLIPMLNQRIDFYLRQSDLTHEIKFEPDLTLEIYNQGSEYDFDSLSRGEQNWAIISLNCGMRDMYEQTHNDINLLMVDELIDFGIDAAQASDAFKIFKNFSRERDKSVSLITHREELFEKADEILFTIKENGFTSYEVRPN